jgi:site-specific recombinase XerD
MPATFKYIIRENRTNQNGTCVIYLRITCNRKLKYHNTGSRIEPKYFRDDPSPGYWIKKSHPNYQTINEDLELILEDAKGAARQLRREDKESAENIKARLVGATKDDFFAFGYDHVDQLEDDNQFWLRKQTKATLSKLAEFNGSENLSFTEVNTSFLEKFQKWMHKEKGNKGSTIRKNMGDMKRLLKLARKQHLIYREPFEDFEHIEINDPGFKTKLSYDQIQKIEALDYPKGSTVWHARNVFILSFYFCGMRFGDLATLRWENVKDGTLNYRMGKTNTEIKVNIRKQAQRFLLYYMPNIGQYLMFSPWEPEKDFNLKTPTVDVDDLFQSVITEHAKARPKGFIFPFCDGLSKRERNNPNKLRKKIGSANANLNQYLDDITEDADINEDVSMHSARHSFAQHGVSKGLSKYKMQMLLGHSSVKTTEKYLKKIDVDVINESMDIIF